MSTVRLVAALRIALAVAMLLGVASLLSDGVRNGDFVFVDFFGYFTIQTNLIGAAVLLCSVPWTGRDRPQWLEWARLCATTYLVIVGIVYWGLLFPQVGPPQNAVADYTLHGVSCVLIVADWLLEGPRSRLPVRGLWVVLIYPAVWLSVTLIRGATDGWVPYFFLDPDNGYGSIAITIAVILATGVVLALALSYGALIRRVRPRDPREYQQVSPSSISVDH